MHSATGNPSRRAVMTRSALNPFLNVYRETERSDDITCKQDTKTQSRSWLQIGFDNPREVRL
jgi:hypothetical protein